MNVTYVGSVGKEKTGEGGRRGEYTAANKAG